MRKIFITSIVLFVLVACACAGTIKIFNGPDEAQRVDLTVPVWAQGLFIQGSQNDFITYTGTLKTNTIKKAFHTNYTAISTDRILICTGTNQQIKLPHCTNYPVAIPLLIVCGNVNGSLIITNSTGAQTIYGWLSQTNYFTNRLQVITDGTNWW